jgi:penicillin-binding protein 2
LERRDDLVLRDSIGRAGLERVFDKELQGVDGAQRIEVDARGNRLRLADRKEPKPGSVIATGLDPYLSQVAAEALGTNKGVALVSDAKTGQLLTMVSSPSFESAVFTPNYDDPGAEQQRMEKIRRLFSDPAQPFFNRAVAGAYPPGSVFKIVTALASLSEGAVDATTTVLDEGILKVGEYQYGNWYFRQYGRTEGEIGLVRAIARSNDIFFYKAAEWTSPNKLAADARSFGFGKATGVELAGEVAGTVPDPAWKEATLGEPWYLGNTYHFGIGQGDLLVTPLQVLQMTQTVANHGELCKPHLLQASDGACTLVGLKDEHLEMVLQGMLDACSPGGTAYPFFERNGGLRTGGNAEADLQRGAVACKTGTAEFGGADAQGYRKTHGWWIGVVEPRIPENKAEQTETTGIATGSAELRKIWSEHARKSGYPERLAITVLVESDDTVPFREGSRDAAPIGKKIIDWLEGNK